MNNKKQPHCITMKTPTNEIVKIKHFEDGRTVCPVCGSISLFESIPAWAPSSKWSENEIVFGNPSFEICADCGTQFGVDDIDKEVKGKTLTINEAWAYLRKEWLQSMIRQNKLDKAIGQLKNIDLNDYDIKVVLEENNK